MKTVVIEIRAAEGGDDAKDLANTQPIRSKGFDIFAVAAGAIVGLPLFAAIAGVVYFTF